MSTYLAWQLSPSFTQGEWDSPDLASNLELRTLDSPDAASLAPKTTLVRIRAAALNFRDLLTVSNSPKYPVALLPGTSPCVDGAGDVVAVGPESAWRVGDRVILAPTTWQSGADQRDFDFKTVLGGGSVHGTLRQLAVVADDRLVAAPANASCEEPACVAGAGVSATRALFGELPDDPNAMKKGDWVLTQGTGGLSLWAIQLAAAAGAKVIATSSSDAKLETVRRLGASHTVNYSQFPDWHEEVFRITEGRGVDRVVEVGGSATILSSLKAARMGGQIFLIGVLSDGDEKGVAAEILYGGKTVVGHLAGSNDILRRTSSFIAKHDLHPVIGATYQLEDAQEAFKALQQQKTVGKVVITMW